MTKPSEQDFNLAAVVEALENIADHPCLDCCADHKAKEALDRLSKLGGKGMILRDKLIIALWIVLIPVMFLVIGVVGAVVISRAFP